MAKNIFKFLSLCLIVFVSCNKDDEIMSDIPDSEQPAIEVGSSLPVVSMAIPEDGFYLLPGQSKTFDPKLTDDSGVSFQWFVDDIKESEESTFTFSSDETGTYLITLIAGNKYGETKKEIKVSVVQQLPISIVFPNQLFFSDSNVVVAEPGRKMYLRPYVTPQTGLSYRWSVNGNVLQDSESILFSFTPEEPGDYLVSLSVYYAGEESAISSFKGEVTAELPVVCVNPIENTGNPDGIFKVLEYVPAPGQYINDIPSGFKDIKTHSDACNYAQSRIDGNNYVSLGGWGGSIVVRAPQSIPNTGGYDFSIDDNSFDTSNEPGIVWVMQDINGNGIPDETWYQLKGSYYGEPDFTQFYAVTYYLPPAKSDTPWIDIDGESGYIKWLGNYHSQDYYYPLWISTDSYTLYGSRLPSQAYQDSQTGLWGNRPFEWGYADNFGSDRINSEGETIMRTFFRIANAVNPDGSPANLKSIDFIKVQTAINGSAGWLGENSTEICGFSIGGKP